MSVSRRDFIKGIGVAAGGGVLGSLAGAGDVRAQQGRSRVVSVTDGRAWSGNGKSDGDLDGAVLEQMVSRALVELTGLTSAAAAIAALIPNISTGAQRIGIKVNSVNNKLPTHPRVVAALARLLIAAGAQAERIVVFDRSNDELAKAGFAPGQGEYSRVVGSDDSSVGYDTTAQSLTDADIRLSKIVSEQIDHLINVPVLKNHAMAGVTLALKNHFGSFVNPNLLHGRNNDGCPGIAEVAALDAIRSRSRFALIDATFGTFHSGLYGAPDFAPMTLMLATDPVAVDATGRRLIDDARGRSGMPPVTAAHIEEAAAKGLGHAASAEIEAMEIILSPVRRDRPSGCDAANSAVPLAGVAAAAALLNR